MAGNICHLHYPTIRSAYLFMCRTEGCGVLMIFLVIIFMSSPEIHQPTNQINSQSCYPSATARPEMSQRRMHRTFWLCAWGRVRRWPRPTSQKCSHYTVPFTINNGEERGHRLTNSVISGFWCGLWIIKLVCAWRNVVIDDHLRLSEPPC